MTGGARRPADPPTQSGGLWHCEAGPVALGENAPQRRSRSSARSVSESEHVSDPKTTGRSLQATTEGQPAAAGNYKETRYAYDTISTSTDVRHRRDCRGRR